MRLGHDHQRQVRCGGSTRRLGRDQDDAAALRSSVAAVALPAARAVSTDALSHVQGRVGNAAMQRLLSVQRWDMAIPANASCDDVFAHIAKKSPYKPQAAYTDAHFKYTPSIEVSSEGGKHKASISNANVDSDITVDMPEWSPEGKMARPWATAKRALRDHEAKHEEIAEQTKPTLRTALEAITATGRSASAAKAAAEKEARAKWRALLAAYQKKQDHLDPYVVELNCPS
jgi:hypothetical protein